MGALAFGFKSSQDRQTHKLASGRGRGGGDKKFTEIGKGSVGDRILLFSLLCTTNPSMHCRPAPSVLLHRPIQEKRESGE